MTSSTPIFPFAKPGAPPPPVFVLLDATELYINPPASPLAFEDLRPASFKKSDRTVARGVRFHPYKEAFPSVRQPTPQPTALNTQPPAVLPPIAAPSNIAAEDPLDSSPLSSPEPSPRSSPVPDDSRDASFGVTSKKIQIKRPKGAARKNLQDQVKWDPAFLTTVKKQTRQLVSLHLDDGLCFKDQDQTKLSLVRKEMIGSFPHLDDYEHQWPLDIIIMGLLKYSSSHVKGTSHKHAIDTVRDFVGPMALNTGRPRRSVAK